MTTTQALPEKKKALWLYETMVTIRQFEERIRREAGAGKPLGMSGSSAGQEAVPTGVCAHLRQDDFVLGSHRSIHHCIAKGLDVKEMMAELMGKATGTNKGKGGAMHIADVGKGMLGANGVVGSNIPLATGAALSARVRGTDQVSVVFFGDGAVNQGTLPESMNLASIWSLPVLFVCENNRYALSTPLEYAVAGADIAGRAAGYAMPGVVVDGQDVLAVYQVAGQAVQRARAGQGPTLIEAHTSRYYGHGSADSSSRYRTQEKQKCDTSRDCIETYKKRLLETTLATPKELTRIDQRVSRLLDEAVKFADESPWPDPSELLTDVYFKYS